MLKFIICEDNKDFLINDCQVINQAMMMSNTEYKTFKFYEYNSDLKKLINSSGTKIYIIDLELKTRSGLDIVREIREKDFYSQIIISSAHDELENRVFKSKMMIFDFISKYDNHNEKLKETIKLILTILEKRNVIKIGTKTSTILIDTNDILYIMKENIDKKCTIKTKDDKFIISTNLCNIEKKLKKNFIKSHRSCLVNPKHINSIDYKELSITFKNGDKIINVISRKFKKEIQNLWNC